MLSRNGASIECRCRSAALLIPDLISIVLWGGGLVFGLAVILGFYPSVELPAPIRAFVTFWCIIWIVAGMLMMRRILLLRILRTRVSNTGGGVRFERRLLWHRSVMDYTYGSFDTIVVTQSKVFSAFDVCGESRNRWTELERSLCKGDAEILAQFLRAVICLKGDVETDGNGCCSRLD